MTHPPSTTIASKTILCDTLIRSGAYLKGDFVLHSGAHSDTYVDCRKAFLNSFWMSSIIPSYVEAFSPHWDEHTLICGVPTSGLVLVGAVLMRAAVHRDIRACYLRPETKDHGTKHDFEGDVREGDKVFVLDDVVTSGKTIISAVERLRMRGLWVEGVVTLLDRSGGSFGELMCGMRIKHINLLEMSELEAYWRSNFMNSLKGGLT